MDMEVRKETGQRVPRRLRERWRLALMIFGPLLIVAGGAWLYFRGAHYESTDDAYVKTARVAISANVAGRVLAIDVRDNQEVHRGDELFRLDDAPFRIAVEAASARLASARLQVESLKASFARSVAGVKAAQGTLAFQQHEYERQQHLMATGVTSQVQLDSARHAYEEARAELARAEQERNGIVATLGGNPDLEVDRHPLVQQAQAALDGARLDLSYTIVKAPADGIVARVEELQVGTHIDAAAPVFALVVTGDAWIEANFKEDQLTHMRAGQTADVRLDSVPGVTFHGRVVSLSPATGSQYSLLPPENATGNWVKVVQRLPVRIELDDVDAGLIMQSGLSAEVRVDTRSDREPVRTAAAAGSLQGAAPAR
jgi:membrane fusion protein (multidrug efflux system)